MLFFRSGEALDDWCRSQGVPRRPTVRIDQLWSLAVTWYGSRLQPDARRPKPDEMRQIFSGLGLDDDFWDPLTDTFD